MWSVEDKKPESTFSRILSKYSNKQFINVSFLLPKDEENIIYLTGRCCTYH